MALKPLTQAEKDAILKAFGGGKAGFKKDANERAKADNERRNSADTLPKILGVDDVKGQYDSARALTTTLGGISRNITADDLEAFRKNIETVRKAYKQGITADQVLDMSLDADFDRAKAQIHTALPTRYQGNTLRFMTNASKDSDVKQHYVTVKFLDLIALATSPIPLLTATKQVANGYLAFDCDCGRHTFWYRYISTIGGFNAGRAETGFPKERNPNLQGVACKHVLKVMSTLNHALAIGKIKEMVKIARKSALPLDELPENQLSAKEVKEAAKRQTEKAHHDKNQVKRASDDPVKQKRIAREKAKLAKASQDAIKNRREERKRIIESGTALEKAQLRQILTNELGLAQEQFSRTQNELYLDAMETIQNNINRLG